MTIREQMEQREYRVLSENATHSADSLGRLREEEPCDVRTAFQRDRDRILHSKSFRRLKNKTQVFLEPEGDHYRTRLTHTLEVSQIGRTVAKALSLNEDLVEAIALGHDLGHTPFGHSGEAALDALLKADGFPGFDHAVQSVRLVEIIEKDGRGLNLTREVVDGIRNHGTDDMPATPEGQIVRLSDKIAYINHDIDDAIRAGVLKEEDLTEVYTDILGKSVKARLNRMIHDVITSSMETGKISQSPDVAEAMMGLRKFMFEHVYVNPLVKGQEQKAQNMLQELYRFYLSHMEEIPASYKLFLERGEKPEIVVCDYISGMTDQYAVQKFEEYFVPKGWRDEV